MSTTLTADAIVQAIMDLHGRRELATRSVNRHPTTGELAEWLGVSVPKMTAALARAQKEGKANRIKVYREVNNVKGYGNFCGTHERERVGWMVDYSHLVELASAKVEGPASLYEPSPCLAPTLHVQPCNCSLLASAQAQPEGGSDG